MLSLIACRPPHIWKSQGLCLMAPKWKWCKTEPFLVGSVVERTQICGHLSRHTYTIHASLDSLHKLLIHLWSVLLLQHTCIRQHDKTHQKKTPCSSSGMHCTCLFGSNTKHGTFLADTALSAIITTNAGDRVQVIWVVICKWPHFRQAHWVAGWDSQASNFFVNLSLPRSGSAMCSSKYVIPLVCRTAISDQALHVGVVVFSQADKHWCCEPYRSIKPDTGERPGSLDHANFASTSRPSMTKENISHACCSAAQQLRSAKNISCTNG